MGDVDVLTVTFTADTTAFSAALTKMADTTERLLILWTHDYVETGEPPYGGRWSRRQMRIR